MPEETTPEATPDLLALTADIVTAHVANNRLSTSELPGLIAGVHSALSGLGEPAGGNVSLIEPEKPTGAVSVRKSLADPTRIISMIDGKPYATLKRHLTTNGLTPEEYRERYGLKPDYPMVAPAYAEKRRMLANAIGLGRKAVATVASAVEAKVEEVVKPPRGRPRKTLSAAFATDKEQTKG